MTTTALDRPQRLATGGPSSPRNAFVLSGGAGQVNPLPVIMKAITVRGVFVGSGAMFAEMNQAIALHHIEPVVDRDLGSARRGRIGDAPVRRHRTTRELGADLPHLVAQRDHAVEPHAREPALTRQSSTW